jgi:ABC-type transport system involved in multi-copper enzyme maturation permease subunit
MKFREIFRFEFAYQLRSVSIWLYFAILTVVAFLFITENYSYDARDGEFFVNAPVIIANVMVFGSLLMLLMTALVAGDAAARDVETRMHSLMYTAPVSKAEHLGGRFLAAFFLNALLLLALPAGILLALRFAGLEPEILGPFNPASYLSTYFFIALPNAFVGTALQFSFATLTRRATGSYLGSMLLFVTSYIVSPVLFMLNPELARLVDPIGSVGIQEMTDVWTPIEKSTRLVALEGLFLWNRLLWLGIALGTLAFTYLRFSLIQHTASIWWSRIKRLTDAPSASTAGISIAERTPVSILQVSRTFGFATRLLQTLAITRESFRTIARSRNVLVILTAIALLLVVLLPLNMKHMGVPFFPRTEYVVTFLTAPLTDPQTPWVIIPLLIIFWAGELTWGEREAGISEIAAAAPVPEWVLFLGKFLGLSLMLIVWMALLAIAGVLAQAVMNYNNFEIGLYLKILFGLQLLKYLLFGCLAFALQVLVNQKHLGYLASLVAYGFIAFASGLGIEHHLLVYSSSPNWSYTDMRGFGSSLEPWLWFKLNWAAWALLLAVTANLFWVRSRESSFKSRFQLARSRFSGSTARIGAAALLIMMSAGCFIFYNTNILNEYQTASEMMQRRAEYERLYGQYENIPQPRLTGTNLHVEIYPDKSAVDIRGTHRLVNNSATAINSIHLATSPEVETGEMSFDRPATLNLADEELNHRIYTFNEPLQSGDSMNLNFDVHYKSQGFRNNEAEFSVAANGSYFKNLNWLPAVGYQPNRELNSAGDRRAHGLAPRPTFPTLDDVEARGLRSGGERIAFEAVVGTSENQTAVALGTLRGTWTEEGRRYFRYSTDAPVENEYSFFSAEYAVHESRWNDVAIQVYHHPEHAGNVERMAESVRASLDYYTKQFGSYPYSYLRFIERPGPGIGMHSDSTTIDYSEGSSRFNPDDDPREFDFVSAVVAHEVAHQWWGGSQLTPAYVEGAPLLSESLAWYSVMGVINQARGHDQQNRFLGFMRETYETPRSRAADPLLRASGWFLGYRKGPLALHALSEYIGEERVTLALRRMLEKHGSGEPPLPTSLDLYRELQAVTPDSHQYLLHDLFETNTFWELKTEQATAVQIKADTWQVTLDVEARKVAVDEKGVETEVPMNDWVEIGFFAPAEKGEEAGKPLYLQMHRINSGIQTITVEMPTKPERAGIDPRYLLIDVKTDNNVRKLKIE